MGLADGDTAFGPETAGLEIPADLGTKGGAQAERGGASTRSDGTADQAERGDDSRTDDGNT